MPVLRYFIVAGLLLLGGLFATDAVMPKQQTTIVVQNEADDALANWRAAEARKSAYARSATANSFGERQQSREGAPFTQASASEPQAVPEAGTTETAAVSAAEAKPSDVKPSDVKPSPVKAAEAPHKARRQMAQSGARVRQVERHPPSLDSQRQDAMARASFAQMNQNTPVFGPRVREANMRPLFGQGRFGLGM